MSLKTRLMEDLKRAMRDGDGLRRDTIRLMRAAIATAESAKRSAFVDSHPLLMSADGTLDVSDADFELDDDELIRVLQKEARQRQDAIVEFRKGGRDDLVAREIAELAIVQEYLPQQLTREEIASLASAVIAETGAQNPSQLGLVMKALMPRVQGRADGRLVSEVVREILAS